MLKKSTVGPWDARFLGNGKTCEAQNSCNLSHLIKQRQKHQKTVPYLTDSFNFTLKLESRQKFCSDMLIRSSKYGKKKYFWFSSMCEPFSFNSFYLVVLRKITNSVTKTTIFSHGGKSDIFFLPYVLDLIKLLEQKLALSRSVQLEALYLEA